MAKKIQESTQDTVHRIGVSINDPMEFASGNTNLVQKIVRIKGDKKFAEQKARNFFAAKGYTVIDTWYVGEVNPAGSVSEAKKPSENRELWNKINRKGVQAPIDRERYTDLSHQGLEGPFRAKTGEILYYDPKEGKYYNRDKDMFVDYGLDETKKPSRVGVKEDNKMPADHPMHSSKTTPKLIKQIKKGLGQKVSEDEFDDFLDGMSDDEMYDYDQKDRHQGKSDKKLGVKLRRGATTDETPIEEDNIAAMRRLQAQQAQSRGELQTVNKTIQALNARKANVKNQEEKDQIQRQLNMQLRKKHELEMTEGIGDTIKKAGKAIVKTITNPVGQADDELSGDDDKKFWLKDLSGAKQVAGPGQRPAIKEELSDDDTSITSKELYNKAAQFMKKQVSTYQGHTEGDNSIPSAPDSAKFSAMRSGMIEYTKGESVHGGQYGANQFFQNFVKIGSNVNGGVARHMKGEFTDWLAEITKIKGKQVRTADGYLVTFSTVDGTNWGGYGLQFIRLDESTVNEDSQNRGAEEAGGSDAHYHRPRNPNKSVNGKRVKLTDPAEIAAYNRGYDDLDDGANGGKQWGNKSSTVNKSINRSVSEAGGPPAAVKYPDNAKGVQKFMVAEINARYLTKMGFPAECNIKADPSVEGVWAVDSMKTGERTIVYMAGYPDPWGKIREVNDFEAGEMPLTAIRKAIESGRVDRKRVERWNLYPDNFAKLEQYFSESISTSKKQVKEDASAGASCSSSVAVVSGPLMKSPVKRSNKAAGKYSNAMTDKTFNSTLIGKGIYESIEGADQEVDATAEMIKQAWKQVMPNSAVSARKILGGWTFRFFLVNGKDECSNGILDNDPFNYSGHLTREGNFEEYHGNLLVNPTKPNMVYDSVKFRKKTIKEPTLEKMVKRFTDIRNWIMSHADNLKNVKFDIKTK